jgi:hypothetical protein
MKYLKKYTTYKESIIVDLMFQNMVELLESLTIWHDALLSSIAAEEVDIYETFNLPVEEYKDKLDLDFLEDHVEFINSLSSIALKKSVLQHSDDYSTFINKPCKFMFIYGINRNELENPEYLLFQSWQETLEKWDDVKCYKVNENIQRFYDKLSSRVLELIDGGDKYIYKTSNGNEWILQNTDKENDTYKKTFRKTELEDLLRDNKIKVNII